MRTTGRCRWRPDIISSTTPARRAAAAFFSTADRSGAIKTSAGGINLLAGQNITVGSGYVITTGGGGINAQALAGSIYTGSDAQGYYFEPNASSIATAYDLGSGSNVKLGGISTAAGGDVNLTAGGSVPGKRILAGQWRRQRRHDGGLRRLWQAGGQCDHCGRRRRDGKLSGGQRHGQHLRGRADGCERQSRCVRQ